MKDVVENALKNRPFFGTSIWICFGDGFAQFLRRQRPRFRIFFDDFSKQKSKCVLEVKKIEKKRATRGQRKIFGSARRNARPPGERKREGSEALRCRRYRKKLGEAELARILKFMSSTPCTTFGGRRIAPRIPPSPLTCSETLQVDDQTNY